MGMKRNRSALWKLLLPFALWLLLLIFLSVVQSASMIAFSVVTKFVIDSAVDQDGKLLQWGITLMAVVAVLLAAYGLQGWFSGRTSDSCMARLRHALLKSAAYSEDHLLQAYHSGELLSRGMEDVNTVCDGMVNTLPSLVGQVARLIGSFLAVLMLCPSLGPVLIGVGVAVAAVSAAVRPFIKKRHREVRKTEDAVMASMQENLQQLELIKGLQVEQQVLNRFREHLNVGLKAKARRRRWTVASGTFVAGASQVGSGALLLWGAAQVATDRLSYGSLSAMMQLLSLFRGPVVGLSGYITKLAGMEVAATRLTELLTPAKEQENAFRKVKVDAVVFENVTFRYPSDETPVVSDFNMEFPLDQWACLTGISGKGKTTLFKLMLGLYSPQEGRVYLKTNRGEILCGKQTRHLFAYVPQDFALFSGTIRENLLLVAPEAGEETCRQALQTAQADFVWDLTHQDQTQVRENNAGLSKGQLQRLAIARAVLMERPIFLLDECTSALDAQTEAAVLANLQKLGKQAILVTHRPEAVEELQRVCFVSMEKE